MKEIVDLLSTSNAASQIRTRRGSHCCWRASQFGMTFATATFQSHMCQLAIESSRVHRRERRFGATFCWHARLHPGAKYRSDRISDFAQRDLLFYVLRDRETFPERCGEKFYCCPKCTSRLYECVSQNVFRYIDNTRWKIAIESGVPDASGAQQ